MTSTAPSRRPGSVWTAHRNASAALYGALVTGAVIALTSSASDDARTVAATEIEVLLAFWAAHVYTRVLADRLRDPDAGLIERTLESVKHEAAILEGGVPALGVFTVAVVLGASTSAAADLALAATVLLLASAGYQVGRLAGARGWVLAGEVAVAAILGMSVVGLKVALH